MNRALASVVLLTLSAAACGGQGESSDAAPDTAAAAGMAAMPMRGTALIAPMRAHLDSLASATGPTLAAALGAHDARAAALLDALGADMAAMGMSADSAWVALTDSVRLDLADLPSLAGRPLEARVRAHVARMRRLLERHSRMM